MSDQVMDIQTQGEKITIGMSRHYKYLLGNIFTFPFIKSATSASTNNLINYNFENLTCQMTFNLGPSEISAHALRQIISKLEEEKITLCTGIQNTLLRYINL